MIQSLYPPSKLFEDMIYSAVYMLSKHSCLADVTSSLVSIGFARAVCHLSHLSAHGGDPRRVPRLHTLSALTQSNTDFCWGGGRRGQAPEHAESQPPQPLWPPTTWSVTLIYKWVTFATTALARGQLAIRVLKGSLTRGEVLIMKGFLRARPGLHMGTLTEPVHDLHWGKL